MRAHALLIGLLSSGVIILSAQAEASALEIEPQTPEPMVITLVGEEERTMSITDWIKHLDSEVDATEQEEETEEAKEPTIHVVEAGESLSSIAREYELEWTDLWNKNESLENPDIIDIGAELVIPEPDEELEARGLPEPPAAPQPQQGVGSSTATRQVATSYNAPASSSGNLYAAGNCTWYAKSRRPDLPNNLGNANTWTARAAAQGIPTGSQPRVGAIGQQGMHVVYVESVHDDGTVTISEMNWEGLYIVSTRRVPASSFSYIY